MNNYESGASPDLDEAESGPLESPLIEIEIQEEEEEMIPAIEELKLPIQHLLEKLRKHINAGDYKLLIGGDASGRIPALIFDKVIKRIYQEKGYDTPRTLTTFFAGGSKTFDTDGEKSSRIKKQILKNYTEENLKERDPSLRETIISKLNLSTPSPYKGRVLIVEDTIFTGYSIQPVIDALKDLGIEFDIATIGIEHHGKSKLGGKKIYNAMQGTPRIYNRPDLAGVAKIRGDLYSERVKSETVPKARRDVDTVANELTEWYLDKYGEGK